MTIICKTAQNGLHLVQMQSHRKSNWMGEGWAEVPAHLEQKAMDCGGYCDLQFDKQGNLAEIIPTERPAPEYGPPSLEEKMQSQIDYLAMMQGVETNVV